MGDDMFVVFFEYVIESVAVIGNSRECVCFPFGNEEINDVWYPWGGGGK